MQSLYVSFIGRYCVTPKGRVPQTRVACIGDSITELSGYPNQVKQILGDDYTVGNFGACGSTVSLDSENPYLYSPAFTEAYDFQPNIAVIMLGTNDANPNLEGQQGKFVEDFLTLLAAFNSLASKPAVWLVKPPHVFDEVWLSGQIFAKEVIPALEEVAKRVNLPIIDVYSATHNGDLFFDGVHPNAEGARIIARVICRTILKSK
jgi:acyl-CoA thioesterase I